MDGKLNTKLWLDGYMRQHAATGQACYVTHRGEKTSGTVAVRLIFPNNQGSKILTQTRDMEGELCWLAAFKGELVAESDADDYLTRLTTRDPDVWVVEVETKDGSHPFTGKILT